MVDRPILFSAPMVRAILAGQKTQTRRALRRQFGQDAVPVEMPKTAPEGWVVGGHSGVWWCDAAANPDDAIRCPYGMPGDQLWVREAFSGDHSQEANPPALWNRSTPFWYWADGNPERGDWTKPRPSIHMPRWASRITLEITGVRVERLQAISDADARAEGVERIDTKFGMRLRTPQWRAYGNEDTQYCISPEASFRTLWSSINGRESWDADPWVWVVEFKPLEADHA